jgi:hypothetical protein
MKNIILTMMLFFVLCSSANAARGIDMKEGNLGTTFYGIDVGVVKYGADDYFNTWLMCVNGKQVLVVKSSGGYAISVTELSLNCNMTKPPTNDGLIPNDEVESSPDKTTETKKLDW